MSWACEGFVREPYMISWAISDLLKFLSLWVTDINESHYSYFRFVYFVFSSNFGQ